MTSQTLVKKLGLTDVKKFNDFLYLTKPTITLLVVITSFPSIVIGSGGFPDGFILLATFLGTALVSSSAAVFNQVFEEDLDLNMLRTQSRSLPSGRLTAKEAFWFGLILGGLGLGTLYFATTPLAAAIALCGHLFYIFIYTLWLKKRTPQNIVIGGMAGAVGPLIGWAAVSGDLAWPAWVLFFIITLWTPPHFWALALKYKEDYKKAGIPMYPVVHGDHKTRRAMMLYSLALIPFVLSLYAFGKAGLLYALVGSTFAIKFAWDSIRIFRSRTNDQVMPFFHFSCAYTFAIFGALALDSLIFN
ncbi:MAG: protoheme IX farnesyltransferase [Deltaproteobacteria bacterium]|nr:protoheme IX farnesyltransferase [Deltaproteobacteria bacterium]